MNMKKFVKENKLISLILGILFSSIITYGTWVTNQIFSQASKMSSHEAGQKEESKSISKQVDEIKGEIGDLKKEVKEEGVKLRKDIVDNQKELLKLLIDIKRDGKK